MKIVKPWVELLSLMHAGEGPLKLIELAARTCYKSEDAITDDSAPEFVDRVCLQKHHESVMEHSAATFRVVTDRGVMAEFTRHRLASFSVESTRYVNYGKEKYGGEITVIEPPYLSETGGYAWREAMQAAERAYMVLIDGGHSPQIARSVLPMCLKTEFVVTMNFRSWRHFLRLRTDKAAHPQMREVAALIGAELAAEVPVLFKEWA